MTKTTRKAYPAGAAALLAVMTLATAAAQPILIRNYHGTFDPASNVHIANLKKNWIVTAEESATGSLELVAWQYANDQLNCKSSVSLFSASSLAIAGVSSSRVVTASIWDGNLQVIVFPVDSNGVIDVQGIFVGGPASTGVGLRQPSRGHSICTRPWYHCEGSRFKTPEGVQGLRELQVAHPPAGGRGAVSGRHAIARGLPARLWR